VKKVDALSDSAACSTLTLAGQAVQLRALDTSAADDRAALLQLHREVFESAADPDWFEWKYRAGGAIGFGLWHEDQLIAHCGGIPRAFSLADGDAILLQIGDVMVAPRWRGIFKRENPFTLVSGAMYEGMLGRGRPYPIGFGFPNARHMRLAVKTGLAHHVGDITELSWQSAASTATLGNFWRLEIVDAPTVAMVEGAWSAMCQDPVSQGLALGVRDWNHVRWRYLDNPGRRYRFAAVRRPWRRQLTGLLVFTENDGLSWLDWIGSPGRILLAAQAACVTSLTLGFDSVRAWCSPMITAALAESSPISRQAVAAIGVPVRSDHGPVEPSQFPWWLMGGDTDFL
jgi:hypothetical protein